MGHRHRGGWTRLRFDALSPSPARSPGGGRRTANACRRRLATPTRRVDYLAAEPAGKPLGVVGIGLAELRQLGCKIVIRFLGRLDRPDPVTRLQERQPPGVLTPGL